MPKVLQFLFPRKKVALSISQVLFGKSVRHGMVARYVLRFIDKAPITQRLLLNMLLAGLEYSPIFLGPLKKPISRMSPEEREKIFSVLSTSQNYHIRTSFTALRTLFTLGLFSLQDTIQEFNLEPNQNPYGQE